MQPQQKTRPGKLVVATLDVILVVAVEMVMEMAMEAAH